MVWLPAFVAGLLTCAGLVFLLEAKHLVPAIRDRARIQRRVPLVELLDAMAKLQLVETSKDLAISTNAPWNYEDDVGAKLDPATVKLLKRGTVGLLKQMEADDDGR